MLQRPDNVKIQLTPDEAELVYRVLDAIDVMNDLVVFLAERPPLLPVEVRERIYQADAALNSARDAFITDNEVQ